jgi:hypothetical protein
VSQSLLRPDLKADIADLARRLDRLERRTTPETPTVPGATIMFSYAGVLIAETSPPARVRHGGTLVELAITLLTAGATDTVLIVGKNETMAAMIAVPAGVTTFDGPVNVHYDAGDQITVAIAVPGTGAADMTAEARFT